MELAHSIVECGFRNAELILEDRLHAKTELYQYISEGSVRKLQEVIQSKEEHYQQGISVNRVESKPKRKF
jgi:hypothetical protein